MMFLKRSKYGEKLWRKTKKIIFAAIAVLGILILAIVTFQASEQEPNTITVSAVSSLTENVTGLQDLTDPQIEKISIGNPDTAPVGKYTRSALTEKGLWNQLENKMVPAEDVKQVLLYVERGEVDAGFVYMTDAKAADPGTVKIAASVPVNTPVKYPIAVVSSSDNKKEAQKFVDFVTGEEGQKNLQKYGFTGTSKQ